MVRAMARPTLNDIALKLGVSKMTVSRALRGEKHVGAARREEIAAMAKKMGYRPDPEITKLMTHMRRARQRATPRTLAFVWAEKDAEAIISVSKSFGVDAQVIGRVEASEKKELLITTPGGMLTY